MKTIEELESLEGERVLVRVDFNVPLEDGKVTDDRRIAAAVPTIEALRSKGAAVILMSHLGRPKGEPKDELRMAPVADRLNEILGVRVRAMEDTIGEPVKEVAARLEPGEVMLLENLRFDPGEKKGDETFGRALASLADRYVNDAFGTSHREHASMVAVARAFPPDRRHVGTLIERELNVLRPVREDPTKPFVLILGGAKVKDKLGVVRALLDRVDRVLLGGPVGLTVLKARGDEVGASKVEDEMLDEAKALLEGEGKDRLELPVDHRVEGSEEPVESLENGSVALDIGPATLERWREILRDARTVVWNGPVGKFEDEGYERGTKGLAETLAASSATTVLGGGETGEAVRRFGVADSLTRISTGGGAFLKYLERGNLPALEALDEG